MHFTYLFSVLQYFINIFALCITESRLYFFFCVFIVVGGIFFVLEEILDVCIHCVFPGYIFVLEIIDYESWNIYESACLHTFATDRSVKTSLTVGRTYFHFYPSIDMLPLQALSWRDMFRDIYTLPTPFATPAVSTLSSVFSFSTCFQTLYAPVSSPRVCCLSSAVDPFFPFWVQVCLINAKAL